LDLGLTGKIALVTGGTRGLGHAIAARLLAEGTEVAFCGRSAESVRQAEAKLRPAAVPPAQLFGTVADVATAAGAARFVADSAAALGGVDRLVANVGGSSGDWLTDSTAEDWLRTFEVNLFHAVNAIRAVVPEMRKRGGGSVVIIASISGWKAGSRAQYATAKAAEIQLARSLGPELAADGIRVNTVSPGSIRYDGGGWDRLARTDPAKYAAYVAEEFPAGRMGRADEVADVVAFLLSDRASWINGAHIPVDGAQGRPTMR
jgi:3-oxoacyl-[acyl-carrier protein] reductase